LSPVTKNDDLCLVNTGDELDSEQPDPYSCIVIRPQKKRNLNHHSFKLV
jgi:hypothetical protein